MIVIRKSLEHYLFYVNGNFQGSCDYNELYQTIDKLKDEFGIDKIKFI